MEPRISQAYNEFMAEYDGDHYFSKRSFSNWKKNYNELKPKITEIYEYISKLENISNKYESLKEIISKYVDYFLIKNDYRNKIKYMTHIFNDGFDLVKKRNEYFIEKEKVVYSDIFASVDGKKLTEDQMVSVITDEANNLVIAGAGTGKTLSILGARARAVFFPL